MRGEPSQPVTLFSQMKGWISGDRLAYLLILFTLAMGAITAYVLASVDFVSGDTDFLVIKTPLNIYVKRLQEQ